MRVIHIINDLAVGGAETVLYRLTIHPATTQHEVICLERRGAYSEKLEAHGIPVHHLDWTSVVASPRAWLRLLRLLRKADADVVQTWMYRSNILGGMAARRAKLPVVWNIRCSSVAPLRPASRILARVGGWLARSVPSRIVNCSAVSAEIHGRLGYDAGGVVIVPNGYDATDYFPNEEMRDATREELGVKPNEFLLGAIGRWDPAKGHAVLLEALRLLAGRGLRLRLIMVGHGLDSSNVELARLIEKSGCGGCVQTLGHRDDVADLARAIDLHVLPSFTEGFPNVIAETMLSGTPNVATDVGDSGRIIGSSGWTVPIRAPEQLADAIVQAHSEWSDAPERWRRRREDGRQHIAQSFALDAMVRTYEKIWDEVASGRLS